MQPHCAIPGTECTILESYRFLSHLVHRSWRSKTTAKGHAPFLCPTHVSRQSLWNILPHLNSLISSSSILHRHTEYPPPGLLRPAPVCRAFCLATWSPFSCTLILWEFGKSEWLVKQEAPCPCQMGSDWNYTVGHDGVRGEPAKELMADEDEDAW